MVFLRIICPWRYGVINKKAASAAYDKIIAEKSIACVFINEAREKSCNGMFYPIVAKVMALPPAPYCQTLFHITFHSANSI